MRMIKCLLFLSDKIIFDNIKKGSEMNDSQILEEVYRRHVAIAQNGDANVPSQARSKEFRDFIEREWQKQDEKNDAYHNDHLDFSGSYSVDVSEIEKHRGLEIGEDGTVKNIN